MEKNQCTGKVEYIPAAPGITLSEMAKYHLSALVPRGRLTRDKDIRRVLAKLFGVSWVEFEPDYAQLLQIVWDTKAMEALNRHRIVSDGGHVYPMMEDKLREEGLELVPSKRSKGAFRVANFTKYLYDFEKECSLDIEIFKQYQMHQDIL